MPPVLVTRQTNTCLALVCIALVCRKCTAKYFLFSHEFREEELTDTNIKVSEDPRLIIGQYLERNFTLDDFLILLEAISSNDRFQQHLGAISLRKILTVVGN